MPEPTADIVFKNARLVLPDTVIHGSLLIREGIIADISSGNTRSEGQDCEGDWLIPGLVELHTDHLEVHYAPRPGVRWNPLAAVQAHDAQIAASGITTVFDALRVGMDEDARITAADMRLLADAIEEGQSRNRLRADHFIHLRCEVSGGDIMSGVRLFETDSRFRLASLMDHTPGQRQFVSLAAYKLYYQGKTGMSDEEFNIYAAKRQAQAAQWSDMNRKAVAELCKERGIVLASHDDATLVHVEEAVRFGTLVAEFPTTLEAAKASHEAGMRVLMGAPNVVRGGSHSGNVSARDLAAHGVLDILSSDYVPFSLIQAAFLLAESVEGLSVNTAINMVTKVPAEVVGLTDRGAIETGRRGDVVRVHLEGDVPLVRSVWREGLRVS
ncbi:alpha-D-ribose 1-methylphosphonate 5-triphosphate diphosphatase [Roseibium litorale]|uniref:Alpha-D-ribose 1-methylphosphonate 5-triphosphate diphosphatase n=1 Tax=Roseibium litorale TaxID=2803841 RepID=A0ABR9CJZ0_9HYPH|nr:alpha-D-ribose 1-methylphosphonate 5-triphosphate diphosphatase [Roseibium litorale]MBD8891169.1 alpha-D-ribose 1-methylphosphonate 5-triphosphate diphosphatase [Roseibium litorale]